MNAGVSPKPFLGWSGLPWRGGDGIDTGTRYLPATMIAPENPRNQGYVGIIGASSFPSIVYQNPKTPSIVIETFIVPNTDGDATFGWSDANLFNSLLQEWGNDAQTDKYAIGFTDNRSSGGVLPGVIYYDWARCTQVTFSGSAGGGPVRVQLAFTCRWGDNEWFPYYTWYNYISQETYPSAPSISPPDGINVAPATSPCQWDFNGDIGAVRSWTLTLIRAQAPDFVDDGTCYVEEIVSGMYSGVLEVTQNPNTSAALINDYGQIILNLSTNKNSSNGGMQVTLKVNHDKLSYPRTTEAGTMVNTYSLIDLGSAGNPATFAAHTRGPILTD